MVIFLLKKPAAVECFNTSCTITFTMVFWGAIPFLKVDLAILIYSILFSKKQLQIYLSMNFLFNRSYFIIRLPQDNWGCKKLSLPLACPETSKRGDPSELLDRVSMYKSRVITMTR